MSESVPKISIVTPSFNQAKYLEETIRSVIDQDYPNLEYIIIDGGSTDESVEIIKKYEKNIHYWISEPDNGMYHAIEKGFKKSNGEIMSWINSDDLLAKDCLFNVAEIFSEFDCIQWLSGIPNIIDENGKVTWVGNLPKWNKYRYLQLDFKYIQQEGTFWRRNLWERTGSRIDTKYKLAGDVELWSRFFQFSDLYFVTVLLGSFRMRAENQKTLEFLDEYNQEAVSILKKIPKSLEEKRNLFLKDSKESWFNKKKRAKAFAIFNTFPPPLLYQREKKGFIIYHQPYPVF
jgi:glycosyltransferase involved in cell wall biosynthesis